MGRVLVVSRCGFCDIVMRSWDERVEHLAQHFRKGLTMDDWKGEHCFEPSIAAQITNALPPYLIASESRAPIPLSAMNPNTIAQLSQIQKASEQGQEGEEVRANDRTIALDQGTAPASLLPLLSDNVASSTSFTEVLTLNLGRYVQEQIRLGIIPTDEMFFAVLFFFLRESAQHAVASVIDLSLCCAVSQYRHVLNQGDSSHPWHCSFTLSHHNRSVPLTIVIAEETNDATASG